MNDLSLDLGLRFLHILSAIILLGGTFFLRFALGSASASSVPSWRPGWSRLVMITSGLLLISGLVNAVRNIIRYDFDVPYHGLVAVKLLLGLAMFFISAVIAGRSSLAEKFREKMMFWLNVNILLGLLTIAVAGYMRFSVRTPKPADDPVPVVSLLHQE